MNEDDFIKEAEVMLKKYKQYCENLDYKNHRDNWDSKDWMIDFEEYWLLWG